MILQQGSGTQLNDHEILENIASDGFTVRLLYRRRLDSQLFPSSDFRKYYWFIAIMVGSGIENISITMD